MTVNIAARVRRLVFLLFLACAMGAAAQRANAAAEQRLALVIGNAEYQGPAALKNPANDAADMARRLGEIGFEVILKVNATQREMTRAVTEFGERLRPGAVALFFYAGHGVQARGRNFLIPVDAEVRSEASLRSEGVDVDHVLEQLAQAGVSLVILDACRNNPFERGFRGTSGSGLAQIDAPKGTLIAYSTAPGRVAVDGTGRNSPYTAELLRALARDQRRVEDVFKEVRISVARATGDRQVPWETSSLTGELLIGRLPAIAPASQSARPAARAPDSGPSEAAFDLAFWDSVRNSRDPGEYRAYLAQFPDGRFAALAGARIRQLEALAAPAPAAAAPAPAAAAPAAAAPAVPVPAAAAPAAATPAAKAPPAIAPAAGPASTTRPAASAAPLRSIEVEGRVLLLPEGSWRGLGAGRARIDYYAATGVPLNIVSPNALRRQAEVVDSSGLLGADGRSLGGAFLVRLPASSGGHGAGYWHVDVCGARDSLHREDYSISFAYPDCLRVRRFDVAAGAPAAFARVLEFAEGEGFAASGTFYEIGYAAYTTDGFVDATFWLPAAGVGGDEGAIGWGRRLPGALRPLAGSGPRRVALPPLR